MAGGKEKIAHGICKSSKKGAENCILDTLLTPQHSRDRICVAV
jgi:hypothetical protein